MEGFEKYRMIAVEEIAPGTLSFRFVPLEGDLLGFRPGQFAFLHILDENGKSIARRPYSIASSPQAEHLEFCIKLVGGEFTSRLEKLKTGDSIGVEKGGGHFSYNDEKKAGFIAGGTGIAPIISMLRYARDRELGGEYVLFYSARAKKDVLYLSELQEIGKKSPNFKIVITLSRSEERGFESGRICKEMIEKHVPDAGDFDWWLCGTMGMVKTLKECLGELGADPKRIRAEGWG